MKKLFICTFLLILLACFGQNVSATEITIQSQNVPNIRYGGTTATLRIWVTQGFTTSDSKPILGGAVGSGNVYKQVDCTVSGTTLTIPQFTIDSTVDGLDYKLAKYIAVLYDFRGTKRDAFPPNLGAFAVPVSLGSTVSWSQLIIYNLGNRVISPQPTWLTTDQTSDMMAATRTAILGSTDVKNKLNCYTPETYGAIVNDGADDRAAIQTAYNLSIAAKGALCIQAAGYNVSSAIELVSNTSIIGVPGSGYSSGGSRIVLTGSNQSIFHVGEGVYNVTIQDIDLEAAGGTSNTKGISFTGNDPNSSQFFEFNRVSFRNFTYGVFIDALDVSNNWQVEQIKFKSCIWNGNTYGIKVEAANAGIQIEGSVFYLPAGGYGIHANAIGIFRVVNTFGARSYTTYCDSYSPSYPYTPVYNSNLGEAFIYINGPHSTIYLETILAEGVKYTFVNNYESLAYAVTIKNSILSDVRLNADTHVVSIGNTLYVNTYEASGATNDTRIYPFGDTLADGSRHKCLGVGTGTGYVMSGGAFVVTQTNINSVYNLSLAVGDSSPMAASDYSNSTKPLFSVGSSVSGRNLLRLGQTVDGAFVNYYDIYRDGTTGFLDIVGNQTGFTGLHHNGVFQFGALSSYGVSQAGTGRIVYDSNNLFKVSENGSAYKNLLVTTTGFTANAIPKATDARGTFTDSRLFDNGADLFLSSGRVLFHAVDNSAPALVRTGTSLDIKLADNSAFADLGTRNIVLNTGTIRTSEAALEDKRIIQLIKNNWSPPGHPNLIWLEGSVANSVKGHAIEIYWTKLPTNTYLNSFGGIVGEVTNQSTVGSGTYGISIGATNTGNNPTFGSAYGGDFIANVRGGGNQLRNTGVLSRVNVFENSVSATSIGYDTVFLFDGASTTVTTAKGINLSGWQKTNGATVTTSYGLFMDNSIDIGTTPWAIYSTSNSPSLITGNLTLGKHLISSGSTPSIAAGTGACTSPTISISGTDIAGVISLTTGTGCAGNTTVFEVTFANAFASAPKGIIIVPVDATTAALAVGEVAYVDQASTTTTKFVVKVGSSGLTNSTSYKWTYLVIQ